MEFNFTINTEKNSLINKDEYPLFWISNRSTCSPTDIGTCKVQIFKNQINCKGLLTTGGIIHTINDIVTAEFKPVDVSLGKYKYGILYKDDENGNQYIYGYCLLSNTFKN